MASARQSDYMDEFKLVYAEKGKLDLKAQIPYLSKLADRHKRRGKKDPRRKWSDLLKAHTLYNSCSVRADVKDKERWMQASYNVQKIYWGQEVAATQDQVEGAANSIKEKLETLRTDMRQKLEPVTSVIRTWRSSFESLESSPDAPEIPFQLCETIKDLSTHCNDTMVDIAYAVMQDAVEYCGKPPCSFSAIAFGSLAKGEATPFSDLEYLFLIEENSTENEHYFERLAVTSYFLIGNVQETNLKYMSIDELRQDKWFEDRAMSGLKIDGLSENAGNIPTGNSRPGTKKNRLILTPDELSGLYKDLLDNPATDQKQPGDLTDMLTYTKEFYNHNNNNLLEMFCKQKSNYVPNEKRNNASKHMLQQDIKAYDFVPDIKHTFEMSCINLKIDIYRYPSILIYDLKIIHAIDETNTWKTLQALLDREVISKPLYDCLLFLLCAAQYIRFSAYLFRNSQEDSVSILPQDTDSYTAITDTSWHIPQSLFFQICLTVLPVKSHITISLDKEKGLRELIKFDKYVAATGFYKTLQEHVNVIQCINKRFPSGCSIDICTAYDLARAYSGCKRSGMSIEILQDITSSMRCSPLAPDVLIFVSTNFGDQDKAFFHVSIELASALARMHETQKALTVLDQFTNNTMDNTMQGLLYGTLADIYFACDNNPQTQKYLKLSLAHSSLAEDDLVQNRVHRADQYFRLAVMKLRVGSVDEAEKIALKSLKLSQQVYGHGNRHTNIAKVHYILGIIANQKKNFSQSEQFFCQAMSINDCPNLKTNIDLAFADLLFAQENYKSALTSYLKCLLHPHAGISNGSFFPDTYKGIGKCYLHLGALPAAELNLQRAKYHYGEMKLQDGTETTKIVVSSECEYYLAQCFQRMGHAVEALMAMKQSLEYICEQVKDSVPEPHFLCDTDGNLRTIISVLKERGELSNDNELTARSCYMALTRIHSVLGNDKLAAKYSKEAEKLSH